MIAILQSKTRFLVAIFLLLLISFVSISLFSYFAANSIISQQVKTNELPLTSEIVYLGIQNDIVPAVIISQSMAQDTHIIEDVLSGNVDAAEVGKYLSSIQEKFNTSTAFFISEKTRNYYHSSGEVEKLSESDSKDSWYFNVLNQENDYVINVVSDSLAQKQSTIYVRHKIFDLNKQVLGVIGVGILSVKLYEKVQQYQNKFDRKVYFTDTEGIIILGSDDIHASGNNIISEGLKSINSQSITTGQGSYYRGGKDVYAEKRFIPELDWYLYVEKKTAPKVGAVSVFWLSLLFCLLVSVLVIKLIRNIINEYQRRLKSLAMFDERTGTKNRLGFESVFDYAMKSSVVTSQNLSALLIKIDDFEDIGAKHGIVNSDIVLKQFAEYLMSQSLCINLICRRVGEEFLMAFPNYDEEGIKKRAEKLSAAIAGQKYILGSGETISITVSIGLASRIDGDSNESIIERAELALQNAQEKGKNHIRLVSE